MAVLGLSTVEPGGAGPHSQSCGIPILPLHWPRTIRAAVCTVIGYWRVQVRHIDLKFRAADRDTAPEPALDPVAPGNLGDKAGPAIACTADTPLRGHFNDSSTAVTRVPLASHGGG